jgi:acyl-CoA reductase-like NAD-dependent aldehyde dehydrogenase
MHHESLVVNGILTSYSAVHINSMTVHDEPVLPHGGVKNSGWGRFNGTQGLEEFLVTKSVTWVD